MSERREKKEKILLKYIRNFSCEFGYKRGTKPFGSIAKENFEELILKFDYVRLFQLRYFLHLSSTLQMAALEYISFEY